ncbi:MAG: hypothetical protein JWP04_3365 [Belnapia sp.]|nr:hypothetical protein [Belnapia sp.]
MLPPPLLHLPYGPGTFRMAMGLTAIPESGWIEIANDYHPQLAERHRLLRERPDEVVAGLPGSEPAQQELLALLARHLARHHPDWFAVTGDRLDNRLTGESWSLAADPLPLIGRLVQEDFCLLRLDEAGPRLVAAVLCFPSGWRLAEKLGHPLGPIHAPVPFYAEALQRPVDRFLAMLKPGRIALRLNWSIMDDPTLFRASAHGRTDHAATVTPANAGTALVLRVERQTFLRLPETGAIAFGIRLHITPLAEVVGQPGEAARLREAVLALPPEMQRYKSLLPFRAALLDYLGALA